ncbi:arginine repressor C-terminal-like domain-containing protein [Tanacetum coccineum]
MCSGVSAKVGLLNIYAPQGSSLKDNLWLSIESLINEIDAIWILFSDFNTVRPMEERTGDRRFTSGLPNSVQNLLRSLINDPNLAGVVSSLWASSLALLSPDLILKNKLKNLSFLESSISLEDVKEVVWCCARSKALRPDGFTFNFIKSYWDVVKNEFLDCIKYFEAIGNIAKACNLSFILLIPKKVDPLGFSDYRPISFIGKILDGCVVANEIIRMASIENLKLLLFKACLSSTSISVLINGSPSKEFKMERGLHQGYPLSPFLFFLVAEALQVTILEACGLKINITKSRLFKVEVPVVDIEVVASSLGCSHVSLPFIYLGLPVGKRMSLAHIKIINLLESIRCRFFWGFMESQRGINWVKWKSILLYSNKGGLGMGSILAKNLGVLGKWRWRFLSEHDALSRAVIKEFYVENRGFDTSPNSFGSGRIWCDILKAIKNVEEITPGVVTGLDLGTFSGDFMLLTLLKTANRASDDLYFLVSLIGDLKLSVDGIDKWLGLWMSQVNICTWRSSLNRLTTHSNLSSREVNVTSSLCPFCENVEEDVEHCLVRCFSCVQKAYKNESTNPLPVVVVDRWLPFMGLQSTFVVVVHLQGIPRGAIMSNGVNGSLRTCIKLMVAYLSSRTMAYIEALILDTFIFSKRAYGIMALMVAYLSSRTMAYIEALILDTFIISKRFVSVSLTHKVTSVVAVVLFLETTTVKSEAGRDADSYSYPIELRCERNPQGPDGIGNYSMNGGRFERHIRSRSTNNDDFELQESRCLQRPIVQSSKWLAARIPEFAKLDHDDLYRAIDIYLKAEEWSKENKDKVFKKYSQTHLWKHLDFPSLGRD